MVVVCDSILVNVFKVFFVVFFLRFDCKVIFFDNGNFLIDFYVVFGFKDLFDCGYELRIVVLEEVENMLFDDVVVMMLIQVDYWIGCVYDMVDLIEKVYGVGVLVIWDFVYLVGVILVDLVGIGVDFVVGCGYKYFNGGLGVFVFFYVVEIYQDRVGFLFIGWMGYEVLFVFDLDYWLVFGVSCMMVGMLLILFLFSFDVVFDVFEDVDMVDIWVKLIFLSEFFIQQVEVKCLQLFLVSF